MATITAFRVTCGTYSRVFFTRYQAEQMARALSLHGPLRGYPVLIEQIQVQA